MKKNKFRKTATTSIIIFAVILGAFVLFFTGYTLFSTGIFDKAPTVKVKANNTYTETIHVVTDKDYRPYSFIDEKGEASGHDVELINMLSNKMEVNLDLQLLSWGECLDKVESGEADILMTCGTADTFDWAVQPIMSGITSHDDYVVYSKHKINYQDIFAAELRIGYMIDGNAVGVISQMGLLDKFVGVDTNKNILLKIQNGELDAGIMRQDIGTTLLEELNIKNVQAQYSLAPSYMCFGIDGNKPEIALKINAALNEMRENGSLTKLNQKWLTTFVQPKTFWGVLTENIWILFILIALVIGLVVSIIVSNSQIGKMNKTLSYEVNELQRRNKIIEGLSNDFVDVSFVTLEEDKQRDQTMNFRINEYLSNMFDKELTFTKRLDILLNNFVYEDDKEKFYKNTRREYILKELSDKDAYFIRFRGVVDGEIYYFELKFNPLKDENGKVTNYVVGLHNVDKDMKSILKQEEKLEEARSLAEQASKAKSTFLFNMSHDIRTPMNAISGYTHLAKENLNDKEKLDDYLTKIDFACGNLIELINQVLEMSRIESGKVELQKTNFNLLEKLNTVLDISRTNASSKNIKISLDVRGIRNKFVCADAGRLVQIVSNIIGNSVKYTLENGYINIIVSQEKIPDSNRCNYKFVIEDNGIGMSEEFLNHVFEEFAREKSSTISKIQGTGLGMSIVKHLVDIFGGTILIESKQGVGTKVSVELPLEVLDIVEEVSLSKEEIDLNGMNILLVEDNEMNREIASEILKDSGVNVTQANDGDVALDIITNSKPGDFDLILMDIQMPKMNGYDATKAIRNLENRELANIPIVAMTANTFEEDKKLAFEVGMNGHIGKPFDIKVLKRTISQFKK